MIMFTTELSKAFRQQTLIGRHLADTRRHAQTRGTQRPAWHWQTRRRDAETGLALADAETGLALTDKAQTRGAD